MNELVILGAGGRVAVCAAIAKSVDDYVFGAGVPTTVRKRI